MNELHKYDTIPGTLHRPRPHHGYGVLAEFKNFDGEIFPDDYSVIRKDRTSGTGGGGVFITHCKDLILTHRPDLYSSCEAVWAQLQIKGAKSVFV